MISDIAGSVRAILRVAGYAAMRTGWFNATPFIKIHRYRYGRAFADPRALEEIVCKETVIRLQRG